MLRMTDHEGGAPAASKTRKATKRAAKPKKATKAEKPAADAPKAEKPKRAKKPKIRPLQETILAKHPFTEGELAEFGRQVGRLRGDVDNLQSDMAAVVKDYKSRIELKETAIKALTTKLQNEYEMRETLSLVVFNTKERTKKFVNPKNKREIYKEEAMTDSDWQLPMFKPEEIAAKAPKKGAPAADGAKPPLPPLAPELHEAAVAHEKVDLDLDVAISDGLMPPKLVTTFKKLAKKAGWAQKIINGVAVHALTRAEAGISAVADELRPFCIKK